MPYIHQITVFTRLWCMFKTDLSNQISELCVWQFENISSCFNTCIFKFYTPYNSWYRLRWSRGSVPAFGTQVRGFKPGRSRRIFKGEKLLSTPSFGGEVKPSVPCRRFAACKRSLELRGSRILDETCRNISRPRRVPPSSARGLSRRWTWRHLAEKVGTSKGGGKQWQPTPKNLPRMQCARAIPVAWVGSGSC